MNASPEKLYRMPQQASEGSPSRPPPNNLCALPRRLQKDADHPTVLPSATLDVLQAPVDDILMSMEVYPQELLTLVAWPEHNYPFYSSISVTYGPVSFCFFSFVFVFRQIGLSCFLFVLWRDPSLVSLYFVFSRTLSPCVFVSPYSGGGGGGGGGGGSGGGGGGGGGGWYCCQVLFVVIGGSLACSPRCALE